MITPHDLAYLQRLNTTLQELINLSPREDLETYEIEQELLLKNCLYLIQELLTNLDRRLKNVIN